MGVIRAAVLGLLLGIASSASADPTFTRLKLSDQFFSEAANVGDFNHDGKMDVVAGPYWYEGPDFKTRHEIYPAVPFDPHGYSKNMSVWVDDFNHDGWDDVLVVGFPGEPAYWFENPKGKDGPWEKHMVTKFVGDESPAYADIRGKGQRALVFDADGRFWYAEPDPKDSNATWVHHPITPKGPWQKFTHGLGVGDINGDGKPDMIEANGWWEQPKNLDGDPLWTFHPVSFGPGGAHMFAYDVNGDGLPDVITSLQAHGYGLAWFEQKRSAEGEITFEKHLIMGSKPEENAQGVVFSEPHSLDLVDIDGDGLKDIVTGKRWWAHGPHGDVEPNAPAVLYWFQLKRSDKTVEWIAHKIDDDSGVGTQVVAHDLDVPNCPAIIVGNKKGTFLFIQKRDTERQDAKDAK